jgi:hypothetical protein
MRDVLGFVLLPLVLFLVAGTLRGFGFAAPSGFAGVGELGMLMAICVLIVGVTCLVSQAPPGQLPVAVVLLVTVASVAVAALGVLFYWLKLESDLGSEAPFGPRRGEYPYTAAIRTLVEFVAVLSVLFAVPRLGKKQ